MPKRIAIIDNGVVVNVALFADDYEPVENQIDVTELPVGPGWTYDGEEFVDPTPEVEPEPVPDVANLKIAVYSQEFGLGPGKARQLVREYPEIMDGLNQQAWNFVHLGVNSALADAVINQEQYDLLQSLMTQFNIPGYDPS